VRWLHPDWTAAEVRSAIVNTADQNVLRNYDATTTETDVNITGAGRENLLSAVNASVAIDPVSISFGAIPSGSGQTQTFTVTLTNLGAGTTFDVAVTPGNGGVTYTVSPASLSLGAGASGTVTITMEAGKGAAFGDHSATFSVSRAGDEVAHAVVYTFIK
jgi:hypothetical protein